MRYIYIGAVYAPYIPAIPIAFRTVPFPWLGPREAHGGRDGKPYPPERDFFIDNLLIRIHLIIVMIRWTSRHGSPFSR